MGFRVDGWGDPLTSWRHSVTARVGRRPGVRPELNNDLLVGADLPSGPRLIPPVARAARRGAAEALRRSGDPVVRAAQALSHDVTDLLAQPLS